MIYLRIKLRKYNETHFRVSFLGQFFGLRVNESDLRIYIFTYFFLLEFERM